MPTTSAEAWEVIASLVGLALLHATWLGLAASGLAAILLPFCAPRARHALLAAALAIVAIGPLILAAGQYAWISSLGAASESGQVSVVPTTIVAAMPTDRPDRDAESVTPSTPIVEAPAAWSRTIGAKFATAVAAVRAARPYVVAAWVVIVPMLAAVLALGMIGVGRIRRAARPAPETVQRRARRLARRLRIGTSPMLGVHDALIEPCLCGVSRPTVLLPGRWLASADPGAIDAVLAHEFAHARRGDHLVNLAQRWVEALLFFHPGVHWLSRSLRRQSEFGADRLAARLTGDPLALARALESLARLRIDPDTPRHVVAALGSDRDSLLPRIQELLGMTPQPVRKKFWPFLALPSAALVALATASAQEPPPSKSAPTVATIEVDPAEPVPVPLDTGTGKESIDYEVRFVTLKAGTWRALMEGHASPGIRTKEGNMSWGMTKEQMSDFIKILVEDPKSNIVQAPRLTALAGSRASIQIEDQAMIARGATLEEARVRIDLTGQIYGIRLLGFEKRLGVGFELDVHQGPAKDDEPPKDPRPYFIGVRDGHSLVVDLDTDDRRERLAIVTPRRMRPRDTIPSRPLLPGDVLNKFLPNSITYEVQSLSLNAGTWRDRAEARLGDALRTEDGRRIWLADSSTTDDIMQAVQAGRMAKLPRVGRIGAPEGELSWIVLTPESVEPGTPDYEESIKVAITGKFSADRRRVALDLDVQTPVNPEDDGIHVVSFDSEAFDAEGRLVSSVHGPEIKPMARNQRVAKTERIKISTGVPLDSTLFIEMGRGGNRDRLVLVRPRLLDRLEIGEKGEIIAVPVAKPEP